MFVARSNVAALPKLYENLIFNRQILSFSIEKKFYHLIEHILRSFSRISSQKLS